ncbi:MAG: hypothetical protein U5L04_02970 [Trueperaceae bacterium]|nr:hypothetical protein [Trueperaceae bacterium]
MSQSKETLRQSTRQSVEAIADRAGLKVIFKEGRRATDLWMLAVVGPRLEVIEAATEMMNELVDADLELITSAQRDDDYKLSMVITDKLEHQASQLPERRAKLRLMLQREQDANTF